MLGFSTLAQTTFASSGGAFPTLYPVEVDESTTVSDPFSAQADFLGADDVYISLTDEGPGAYNFFGYVEDGVDIVSEDAGQFEAKATTTESFSVTLIDVGSAFAFLKEVDETVAILVDEVYGNADYNDPTVDETPAITDDMGGFRGQFATTEEEVTIDTVEDVQAEFAPTVNETTTVSSTPTPQVDFKPTTSELITLIDYIPVSGWIKIDDSQPSTWTPINDAQ